MGGKSKNMHKSKRLNAGRGTVGKIPVVGARQRNGKVKAKPVTGTDTASLQGFIAADTVEAGSTVYTDDHPAYRGMPDVDHETVKHSLGEYVQGAAHTNSVESVWAVLKRSVYGTWHHVSEKHLARYVDETAFRLNEGNCKVHTLVRMDSFVRQAFQHRITYRELTA